MRWLLFITLFLGMGWSGEISAGTNSIIDKRSVERSGNLRIRARVRRQSEIRIQERSLSGIRIRTQDRGGLIEKSDPHSRKIYILHSSNEISIPHPSAQAVTLTLSPL